MKKIASIILIVMSISCLAWAQKITVTSPNGGEILVLGKQWPITWTAVNVAEKVKIQLVNPGGALVGVIDNNLASDSSPYPWTIGQTKSGMAGAGDYKIRVVTLDGSKHDASDTQFKIAEATPPVVIHKKLEPLPLPRLKFPRLAVSGIDLVPNADGFGIIFSYKNVGDAALPKASEVPVKPNYRVLIDGKETAHGSLIIPVFPAPPGWEQAGYFGGWIMLPTMAILIHQTPGNMLYNEDAALYKWYIGNMITVHINENKVMGMDSHTLGLNLKPIALKYNYDLLCTGVTYDWNTHILQIIVRLDGKIPAHGVFALVCKNAYLPDKLYYISPIMDKRLFYFTKKIDVPKFVNYARFDVYVVGKWASDQEKIGDIDMRNNMYILRCQRPQ